MPTLAADAYVTLFLHACKHSSKAVNGLLLGSVDANNNIMALKALPLFHSSFALSPMLEVALMLADEFCKQEKGLQIVGYYQANELSGDLDLGPFGRKIAEKIRTQCPCAVVLLLDGSKMQASTDDLRLLALSAEGKQTGQEITLVNSVQTIELLEKRISCGAHQQLVDFDAHLDDSTKDWLNSSLLS